MYLSLVEEILNPTIDRLHVEWLTLKRTGRRQTLSWVDYHKKQGVLAALKAKFIYLSDVRDGFWVTTNPTVYSMRGMLGDANSDLLREMVRKALAPLLGEAEAEIVRLQKLVKELERDRERAMYPRDSIDS